MALEDPTHGASAPVSPSQAAFVDFMCESGVLTFGDFTTKSGRKTPYFVNTGLYSTGAQMATLGDAYAEAALERFGDGFDVLFGPAYKGIPLVVATAAALHRREGRDVPLVFNRKEAKEHGEGGVLVGHRLKDGERVLILEDVTTAGTSIRETVPLLRAAAKVEIAGLLVSVAVGWSTFPLRLHYQDNVPVLMLSCVLAKTPRPLDPQTLRPSDP